MRVCSYEDLERLSQALPLYLWMRWLRAIAVACCKNHCLQFQSPFPFGFGCDAKDEVRHYYVCHILRQLPREFPVCPEVSVNLQEALCFASLAGDKVRILAFLYDLYHGCTNDICCFQCDGQVLLLCAEEGCGVV